MKIVNISYRGRVTCPLSELKFSLPMKSPQMLKYKCGNDMKLLVFKSGKCRLMGCKQPITRPIKCEVPYILTSLMSLTLTMDMGEGRRVNLYKLAVHLTCKECIYEPELFPAVRLTKFSPLCVNVFQSGKDVILGLKSFTYDKLCTSIRQVLSDFLY